MADQRPGDCIVPLPSRNNTLLLLTTAVLGLAISITIRAAGIARSDPLATLLPELRAPHPHTEHNMSKMFFDHEKLKNILHTTDKHKNEDPNIQTLIDSRIFS